MRPDWAHHTILRGPPRDICHGSLRPSEIKYFRIEVHNPYREELIELNPGMSSFFEVENV